MKYSILLAFITSLLIEILRYFISCGSLYCNFIISIILLFVASYLLIIKSRRKKIYVILLYFTIFILIIEFTDLIILIITETIIGKINIITTINVWGSTFFKLNVIIYIFIFILSYLLIFITTKVKLKINE